MSTTAATDLTPADLAELRTIAEQAVVAAVRERRRLDVQPARVAPALQRPGAVFVTLRRDGALRGCIGTMSPMRSLAFATADRAWAAALDDPRFDPVRADELPGLSVEVSVLTPMEPFSVGSYEELVRTLRPGVDGLLVEAGRRRATFLPSVWEELPDPASFVAALWRKAAMPAGAWPDGIHTWRYRTQHS